MAQLVVRNLGAKTIQRLKARARRHGRSLEAEVRLLLERTADAEAADVARLLAGWDRRLGGRRFSDGAAMAYEDREG
ncbi:MAG: FitA-like ribbon-helix-helix domain-containing protein [Planctomycetota bacterium]